MKSNFAMKERLSMYRMILYCIKKILIKKIAMTELIQKYKPLNFLLKFGNIVLGQFYIDML